MKYIGVFTTGLIFSFGLILSGMINPAKVLGFLDIFGEWDPSLAFVMGGAVLASSIGYRLLLKQPKPIFAAKFSLPSRTDIDTRLLVGPAIFGFGWGLVGLCPGPAFAALAVSPKPVLLFVIAMLFGMFLARTLNTYLDSKGTASIGAHSHGHS